MLVFVAGTIHAPMRCQRTDTLLSWLTNTLADILSVQEDASLDPPTYHGAFPSIKYLGCRYRLCVPVTTDDKEACCSDL